jgi:hypothetical protein
LADLFGNGAAAHGCLGETQQAGLVLAHELSERGLVAGAQPCDESEVAVHAGRGYDVTPRPAGNVDH